MDSPQVFDPTNPRYKCCCGCHVTTGTQIICWTNIALLALVTVSNIFLYPNQPEVIGVSVVLLLISLFVVATPLYGIRKSNPKWLLPYLIFSVISISLLIISFLLTLYRLFIEKNHHEKPWGYPMEHPQKDMTMVYVFVFLRGIISIGLNLWFFLIVYRCYQYLTAKSDAEILPITQ